MTARELIEKLQKLPEGSLNLPVGMEVVYDSDDGPYEMKQEIQEIIIEEDSYLKPDIPRKTIDDGWREGKIIIIK